MLIKSFKMLKIQVLFSLFICLLSCKDEGPSDAITVDKDSVIDYTPKRHIEDSVSNVAYFVPLYDRSHIASDSMNVSIREKKYIQTVDIINTKKKILNGAKSIWELEMKVKNQFSESVFYFTVPGIYEKVQNGLNIRKDTSTGIFYVGCYDRAYPFNPKNYFYSFYEVFINEKWASDGVVEMRYVPKKMQLSKKDLDSIKLH